MVKQNIKCYAHWIVNKCAPSVEIYINELFTAETFRWAFVCVSWCTVIHINSEECVLYGKIILWGVIFL